MKKNIFGLLALLAMLGFVSCDMGRQDTDTIEPQQQEEEYFEVDEFETEDPAMGDEAIDEQRMEDDESRLEDDESIMDDDEQRMEDDEANYDAGYDETDSDESNN